MTIKVEHFKDVNGHLNFAFQTNDSTEVEVLDMLRVAFLGNFPRRGGFVNSQRLVIEVNPGNKVEELPSNG